MIIAKSTSVRYLLLILGCHHFTLFQHTSASQAVPPDTFITLERTACFGRCPVYKLSVDADGAVVFEGKRFVRHQGTAKGKISVEQVKQLISAFDGARYFSLRDRYFGPGDGCPTLWTCNPSAITSITVNGRSKEVTHYYGCQEKRGNPNEAARVYPRGLTELEAKIDEVVGSKRWVE